MKESSLTSTFKQRYTRTKWWADKRTWEKKEGSKEVKIVEVRTYNSRGKQTNIFKPDEAVRLEARFIVEKEVKATHFGVAIFREDGAYCYGPNTLFDGQPVEKLSPGEGFFSIEYKALALCPGHYRFSAAVWDSNELWAYDYHSGFYKFEIVGENKNSQLLNLDYDWEPAAKEQKFGIFTPAESSVPFEPEYKLSDHTGTSVAQIAQVQILDAAGLARSEFHTGEDLSVKIQLDLSGVLHNGYLWAGIFRNDDIYCHGVSRKLKEPTVVLHYPKLPLLTGDYYLSVGIWKKDQKEPLIYRHNIANFKMHFGGQDHGTVYLEHVWKMQLPFRND